MREDIAPLFGLTFNTGSWNQGFVVCGGQIFLLVTINKGSLNEDHRYDDKFISSDRFQWQSQNRTTQESSHGEMIKNHISKGISVNLFVRKNKLINGKSSPFIYCGPVEFLEWHGNQPITVQWKLLEPVPQTLLKALDVLSS